MKLLFTVILLFACALYCKSQDLNPQEKERRDKLISDCRCPNQVFNTDSVYNFFQSDFLKPYKKRNHIFIIEDNPIPFNTVLDQSARQFFFEYLRGYYEDYARNRKEEIIPPKVLRKMLSVALDSTTQYTEPIVKWNVARIGEQWMNQSAHKYYEDLFISKIEEKMFDENRIEKKDYKKYRQGLDVYIFTNEDIGKVFITVSVPVFDDEYKYAFMVYRFGIEENYGFALFKRDEQGWKPILVKNGDRFSYSIIRSDFSR